MGNEPGPDALARTATIPTIRIPPVSIRPLRTQHEYRACVELQLQTWGARFNEVVSPTILKISQRVGGVAAGAFNESGDLLGFVFGLSGVERGRIVHWSHMLAVRESARDAGIGRRLKEYQRDFLRPLGVERIYWTFDPLVARNAHLNLNRIGAEVIDHVVNMYGETASELHSGLGTDRFVMAWDMTRSTARSGRAGRGTPLDPAALARIPVVNEVRADGRPMALELPLSPAPAVRIAVPADIQQVKAASRDAAAVWRTTTRQAFSWYLDRGYRVVGFQRERETGRSYYVLRSGEASRGDSPHESASKAESAPEVGQDPEAPRGPAVTAEPPPGAASDPEPPPGAAFNAEPARGAASSTEPARRAASNVEPAHGAISNLQSHESASETESQPGVAPNGESAHGLTVARYA